MSSTHRITLIATGGTIAKTYANNGIGNDRLVIDTIVAPLRLPDVDIRYVDLLRLDSLDMTDEHRLTIARETLHALSNDTAVVITHGTDTMVDTGLVIERLIQSEIKRTSQKKLKPVILTGAMLPHSMHGSDATQNLTESLLASRLLPHGVYVVFHNRVLPLPHVRKNHQLGTFEATAD